VTGSLSRIVYSLEVTFDDADVTESSHCSYNHNTSNITASRWTTPPTLYNIVGFQRETVQAASIFIACRDVRIAVLSTRVTVTLRYYVKTAKHSVQRKNSPSFL